MSLSNKDLHFLHSYQKFHIHYRNIIFLHNKAMFDRQIHYIQEKPPRMFPLA